MRDYFGLPADFHSEVAYAPCIENIVVDGNLYYSLDQWWNNSYIRFHIPFVYTRRSMNSTEYIINSGTKAYLPGYFAPSSVDRNQLVSDFSSFISGNSVPNLPDQVEFEPLRFAKISEKTEIKLGFSEPELVIGYNILSDPEYHFGFNLRVVVPVGTRPSGEFFFEPIIGNGHHWGVGIGLTLHALLWSDECKQSDELAFYIDGNITSLVTTKQHRFFDIRERLHSRYMLAHKLLLPITDQLHAVNEEGDREFPDAQFKLQYMPVANITRIRVNVDGGFQADVAFMLQYRRGNIIFDSGYNYWHRSCEEVTLDHNCLPEQLTRTTWALKGDSHLFGFNEISALPTALSATQSNATIHTGRNRVLEPTELFSIARANPRINSPQEALVISDEELRSEPGGDEVINTSIQPVFIRPESLDLCSSRTDSTIHNIFIHLSYQGNTIKYGIPYIGIGGKIGGSFIDDDSFKQTSASRCDDACSSSQCASCTACLDECLSCGLVEWGVWLRGGLAF